MTAILKNFIGGEWVDGSGVTKNINPSNTNDLVGEWLYSWAKWYGSLAGCAVLLYAASCRVVLGRPVTASLKAEGTEAMPVQRAA